MRTATMDRNALHLQLRHWCKPFEGKLVFAFAGRFWETLYLVFRLQRLYRWFVEIQVQSFLLFTEHHPSQTQPITLTLTMNCT